MKKIQYNHEDELNFISGKYFYCNLPKEKLYLYKYFRTDVQRQFLRYYITFGNTRLFRKHTGYKTTERWLRMLKNKLIFLEEEREEARREFDLEKVAEIESGEYKC
jgi:hypothetical protein